MLRLLHFLDSWFTDDGDVSLMRWLPFTSQEDPLVLISLKRMGRPQGHSLAGMLSQVKNAVTLSGIEPVTFKLVA
jgi:hypothetical protein